MTDFRMIHRTGMFGLAVVVLTWAQFPLWLIGAAPSVYDGAAFGRHLLAIKNVLQAERVLQE